MCLYDFADLRISFVGDTQILRIFIIRDTHILRISIAIIAYLLYYHIKVMKMTLKELRKQQNMTQKECADFLGIPLRTYQNYETDIKKVQSLKYRFMIDQLQRTGLFDEEHGILSLTQIKDICSEVFDKYGIAYAYLFGSYAKDKATATSDIDLLISSGLTGMSFFDMTELLRERLKKKVDVLTCDQLNNNPELINEILKDGVRIYG